MEAGKTVFAGDSPAAIFEEMTKNSLGLTPKTKARFFLETFYITDELPDVNDKEAFYEGFFKVLRNNMVGVWKWYDSLYNDDDWRFSYAKNDLVRRVGAGNYRRSEEQLAKLRQNIAKSHEARRNNPELAKHIAHLAGLASAKKGGREWTPEQRRERGQFLLRKRLEKIAAMSPEEREAEHLRRSEKMKAAHARRRAAGVEYNGRKADQAIAAEAERREEAIRQVERDMEALENGGQE